MEFPFYGILLIEVHSMKGKVMILVVLILTGCLLGGFLLMKKDSTEELETFYIAATTKELVVKDEEEHDQLFVRGLAVQLVEKDVLLGEETYDQVKVDDKIYYVPSSHLVSKREDTVLEKELFVRTSATVYKEPDSIKIQGFLKKGSKVEILGYVHLKDDGSVDKYKIQYEGKEAYIRSTYLVETKEEAEAVYDAQGSYLTHQKMGVTKGGDASQLDYYPVSKEKFSSNPMPEEVRALYLNATVLTKLEDYITLAKESNINAFVVDIKENTVPAYEADAMQEYSKTNYERALYTKEEYKEFIQKLKENGFYVIGRISTFKDSYYAQDHPEETIHNKTTNTPLKHNNSYWPSAYQRGVWEFNVALAVESVRDIGFHEIQFDYVRFPDQTGTLENAGTIDFKNDYQESKAQAIQAFVMYAADELHEYEAYISVDVFGESAHDYVASYGQYWPAISNVVDVISGMPYPDHFNPHEYGINSVYVWQDPYAVLCAWGAYAKGKQDLIPTPAIARTWIQAYDTTKTPSVKYDANKVGEEIRGLYSQGLTGGYMTWNSGSSLTKYKEIAGAFKRGYVR